jgi:hypothetical protein
MSYIGFLLRKAIYGRLLVSLWKDENKRREMRNQVLTELCEQYVHDIPAIVPEDSNTVRQPKEYIFSMWLQGEENAPEIVRSCWESIRRHCAEELVILDADNISHWIDLPEGFLERWRKGKIISSHVSDLCRIELLWKYGGYWMDATDYVCHPIPEFIVEQPFFLYLGDESGYSPFIQSCFIRAYAHHPVIGAWRGAFRTYWQKHRKACDYFVLHRLFRHCVLSNPEVANLFNQMPHISHYCTHSVRWGGHWDNPFDEDTFRQITSEGAFQKMEYKSASSQTPVPGTFADYFVHGRA